MGGFGVAPGPGAQHLLHLLCAFIPPMKPRRWAGSPCLLAHSDSTWRGMESPTLIPAAHKLWSQQSPGTVTRTQQEGWRQRCHRGNCDARSCSKGLRAAGSGRAGSTVHGACTALQISHTSQHICAACRSLPDVPPALGTFLPAVVEVGRAASCPARSWHAGPSRQDRD